MDSRKVSNRGKLNNAVTKFGKFTWGDNDKLRRAIQEVREKMGGDLPVRFKVKI